MSDEKSMTPATDAVKALARLLHRSEVEDEPRELMRAELKSAGIDSAAVLKTVREKITQAKSRQRLAIARERRQALLGRVAELGATAARGRERLLERVKELLDEQFGGEQKAVVLFRKFEEAKEEDLQSLLDDIILLDDSEDEDERPST